MQEFKNQLLEAFGLIVLSGDQQKVQTGQQFLEQNKFNPQYASVLMLIIDQEDIEFGFRQLALTQLKELISYWKPSKEKPQLEESTRNQIKENILQGIIRVSEKKLLYKQYGRIINKIGACDFPQNWTQLVPQVQEKIQNAEDYCALFGSLTALDNIFQIYEYMIGKDRNPIEVLVKDTFDQIILLASKIYQNYNEKTAAIMNLILKIFLKAINFDIPTYIANTEKLKEWFTLFKLILEFDVPEECKQFPKSSDEQDKLNKLFLWKNKKLCGRILMRFAQKYSNKKYETPDNKGLSDYFLSQQSTIFFDILYQMLYATKTQFISLPTIHYSLRYIQMCIRIEELEKHYSDKLIPLVKEVLVSLTVLNQNEIEQFEDDPIEYMRKEEDFSQTQFNPKNAALDLITAICKLKPQNLMQLMEFLYQCFSTNSFNGVQLSMQQIDGMIWVLGELYSLFEHKSNQELQKQIEPILEKFVLPLAQRPEEFIQSRVNWIYGMYGHLKFQNQTTIQTVTGLICKGISSNNQVMSTRSCIALHFFIKNKEDCQNIVRPEVQALVDYYLKLMSQVDNEHLVGALEGIIETFPQECKQFAYRLVQSLVEQFYKYSEAEEENANEAEFAAAGCLQAVIQLMKSNLDQQIYLQLEQLLFPVVCQCIQQDAEYLSEGLEIIGILIYKLAELNENLYFLFVCGCYLLIGIPDEISLVDKNLNGIQLQAMQSCRDGWGIDFTDKLLPVFKNVIKKNKDFFNTGKDFMGQSFIDLMFAAVDKTISVGMEEMCDEDENGQIDEADENSEMANILHFFTAYIENNLGNQQAQPVIEKIVRVQLQYLDKHNKFHRFAKQLLFNICLAMYYDFKLVLKVLEEFKITSIFYKTLCTEILRDQKVHQNEDLEIQRLMLGLNQIFTLQQNEILPGMQENMILIMQTVLFGVKMALQLREEDEDDDDDGEDDMDYYQKANYCENYDVPIDEVDEAYDLRTKLQQLQQRDADLFNQIYNLYNQQQQAQLTQFLQEAEKQHQEFLASRQQQK